MQINQVPGGKPDQVMVNIRNADTVTIPVGSPIVLLYNGTDDGLAVALPSTVNLAKC